MLNALLLGHPRLFLDGNEVKIPSRKAAALLYFLLLSDRSHSRTSLAGLFWGDVTEQSARRSLRVALTKLRAAIGDYVIADRTRIGFDHHRPHQVDTIILRQALAGLPGGVATAREAVQLLRGEFLEDFHVGGAPEFENWQLGQRERSDRAGRALLLALVEHDHQTGQLEQALAYARRLLAMDPWREEAQRWVMRLLAELGRTTAALAQYERCRELLAQELGVEPARETVELAEAIRALLVQPTAPAASQPGAHQLNLLPDVPHNLPVAGTAFVGRAAELDQIERLFDNRQCQLLTLLGPGGVGKSRLALEAARRWLKAPVAPFPDGIFFIPLSAATAGDDLFQLIAAGLELALGGDHPAGEQLLGHLSGRQMLLILDNFESLPDQAGRLLELIGRAPGVRLLVTSQERLPLMEAWNLDLLGLESPPTSQHDGLEEYSAVQLFFERARRLALDFDLQAEAEGVAEICRLVDGLPLAIELAAAWVRGFPCQEIARRIAADLAFLQTISPSLPPRQRSLEAVFMHSWALLATEEQAIYAALSAFQGGFTTKAAQQVAGAPLRQLLSLRDKSLLQRLPSGRYEMHQILRQLATRQLRAEEAQQLARRHAEHYVRFLHHRQGFRREPDIPAVLDEIAADLDNIRKAWRWAAAAGDDHLLDQAMRCLTHFYDLRGYFAEGDAAFSLAAEGLPPGSTLAARLTYRRARFAFRLGRNEMARDLAEGALAGLEQQGAQRDVAGCLLVLGNAVRDMGDHAAARSHFSRSAALFEALDDLLGLAAAANNLGVVYFYEDDLQGAVDQFKQALAALERAGVEDTMTEMGNIGLCYGDMGQHQQAIEYLQRSLAMAERFNAPLSAGLAHHNLGNAHRLSGAPETAAEHLRTAIAIFRELDSRDALAAALADLATAYIELAQYEDAEAALQEGLELEVALARPRGITHKYLGMGNLHLAQGDHEQALHYYRQVLAQSEEEVGSAPLLNALLGAAVIQARAGQQAQLQAVLATVQAHPQAGHETQRNLRAYAQELAVEIDPLQAWPKEKLAILAQATLGENPD